MPARRIFSRTSACTPPTREMLADLMTRIYTEEAAPKEHLLPHVMKSAKESQVSLFDLARDILEGVRAL